MSDSALLSASPTHHFHFGRAYKREMDGGARLPQEIVAALARGGTVLTGNQRAARSIQHAFDLHQRAAGLQSWSPPAVSAWDAWTAHLWQNLILNGHTTRLLLNRSQEHVIWRAVIAADPGAVSLRSLDSLAEMAADAWSRLCAYQGEQRLRTSGISADTRAFQRWASAFERRCRTDDLLSAARLEAMLTIEILAGRVLLPAGGLTLIGFDSMTPAQEAVVQAIRSMGREVNVWRSEAESPGIVASADNERDELLTAARWIRSYVEGHPAASVALIVPDLASRRAAVDRVLRTILAPELQDVTNNPFIAPFEFSLGVPLSATPMVASTLDLLRWTIQPLSLEAISDLLLSPHFAGGGERSARATFDASELRRLRTLRPEQTLSGFLDAVEGARRRSSLPLLLASLRAMSRVVTAKGLASDELRSAADWAESMRALLQAAGWAKGDDSIEFQTRRKWESLLDELAMLDFEGVPMTFADALRTTVRLAQKTLFAPESRNAPVQVMGPLESAGSSFDAVWFLGAGDLRWPPRPATNPLLAWTLQVDQRMPGSDPALDSEHARRLTERIARSAPTVVFSYAEETAEGRQRPSVSLSGLALEAKAVSDLVAPAEPRMIISLEDVADDRALPPLPDRVLRGGADLLKQQAACGFRAFAEKRLWATALESAEPGMDARARGNAVHLALQHFWTEVKTQDRLRAMPSDERRRVLAEAIDTALREPDAVRASTWDAAYMEVQRERLMALLDPWLLAERGRTVPFTVKQSETALRDVQVGPLRLSLRVDRIDETEFGDVILDYKTGAVNPSAWLTERPEEPQLPLYAVLAQSEQLAGIGFAQIRAGKDMALVGYQAQDGVLLKPTRLKEAATLEDQVELWREVLTSLAEDFYRGDVRVRPKKYPNTCEYCAQRLLCRLDITQFEGSGDDEGEEEHG